MRPVDVKSLPQESHAQSERQPLRAALVQQPDGSYLNMLGVEGDEFFKTLASIRAETPAREVERLFDFAH